MADLLNTHFEHGFCKIGVQYTPKQLKKFSEQLRLLELQRKGEIPKNVPQASPDDEIRSGFIK